MGYDVLGGESTAARTLYAVYFFSRPFLPSFTVERIVAHDFAFRRSSLTFSFHLSTTHASTVSARLDSLAAVQTGSGDRATQESRCCYFSALREGLCSASAALQSVKSHHGSVIQLDHDTRKFRFKAQRACLP